MAKKIKLRDKSANQLIPITRSTVVEMNDGMTLQTAYEGINSTHYTKAEINAAGYLQSFTETDPTVPSHVKSITQQDITNWNNKLDSFTETDPIYSASAASVITSTDISNWNSKTDNVGTITGITMNGASKGTSGVVDLGTVLTSHQSLSSYVTSGYYDTTTRKIYLRHGTNVLSEIDANDFIKDGMVDTAYVQGSNLVISFNTDAGKQPVEVPIADIFNPTNYYTKTEINNAGYLTAHQDLSSYVSKTELNAAGYLTSHQSIKTINGNTITGTGDVTISGLPAVNSTYNGKILQVVDGAWAFVTPLNLYSGTGTPNNTQGNNGDLYMQI